MLSATKKQLLPYAIVTLFGLIGFTLPLPILPQMFLDSEKSILPSDYSSFLRNFLLGVVMMSFPLGQLIGSPILGRLSDCYGRKPTILLSLGGNSLGYLFTGCAIAFSNIWGIFVGLFFCGFCEGNIAISQSVVADVCEHEPVSKRAVYFGWIEMFICAGAIIGPLLGGQLSDTRLVSWFSFATPFYAAALITLLGVGVILLSSKETKNFTKKIHQQMPLSFWKLLLLPKLRIFYLANFFLALAMYAFYRFCPVFLEQRFNMTPPSIAYVLSYEALINGLAQLWIVKCLSERFSPKTLTASFSVMLALSFIIFLLPATPYATIITVLLIGIALGVTITNASVMVSLEVSPHMQGHALGTLISVHMAGALVIAFFGGLLSAKSSFLPLSVGAAMAMICALILFATYRKSNILEES